MGVRIITENGKEIELPAKLVAESNPAVIESFVAAERVKLGLSPQPPGAEVADDAIEDDTEE